MRLADYENDLFISYAHIDNEPLTDGQKGWVDNFHRTLEVRLAQLLGERPRVWRDPKLQGNDVFADEIVDRYGSVALLVSVLTPRYVRSEWCTRELHEFHAAAAMKGGVAIGNRSRIFKVIKTPVPDEECPSEVQGLLGYEFFEPVPPDGFRELSQDVNVRAGREYLNRLEDLAQEICRLLDSLRGDATHDDATPERTVFVAAATRDVRGEVDAVRRELVEQGFHVLPERALPHDQPGLERALESDLARSRLSVHLVGRAYGLVPEGASRSIVEIQNELAARRSRSGDLARLIWLASAARVDDERQKQVLARLENDPEAQVGADLLRGSIEELKTVIHQKLERIGAAPDGGGGAAAAGKHVRRVYLIYDDSDADGIAPLADHLFQAGLEVVHPLQEGDETEIREDHHEALTACDAVLVFWGRVSERWQRVKVRDLRKAAAWRGGEPFRARAIWIAGPETAAKQRFRSNEIMVLRADEAGSPSALGPFLDSLAGTEEGER